MHRLYTILQLFKEYIVLALFIFCSIILLLSNNNIQIQYIRSLTVAVMGVAENTFSFIPNLFELPRENRILRRRTVELADEVAKLREARLENIRLRKLLRFASTTQFRIISAEVISKNLHLLHNTMVINVGSSDSVAPSMPVISDAGLVGRITTVSTNYSIVQLMLNRDFRASVKIQRSRVDGILAWQGGMIAIIKNISKSQDVRVGDLVITSEYSNTFPPNIEVGIISSVSDEIGTLFKKVAVQPSVDFARLQEVFVIRTTPDSAREAIFLKLPKE
ncbi:MAG: rod shape-determining protein MreC [Bacteroidota bacterium]